jgi:hypothetical protein
MQHGARAGFDNYILLCLLEIRRGDCNGVFAERDCAEVKFSAVIRFLVLHVFGMLGLEVDIRVQDGTVLRIVHNAVYMPENFRARSRGIRQDGAQAKNQRQSQMDETLLDIHGLPFLN